ncbi:Rho guanine nucleotide exchange factor [Marasmius crinis-equi]|uniref:Rho guanine nucleotide exchange factor n=1 Tax=Marasmius crinis-equi TaxID=585013 RepID=A0ABR3EUP1_9AGAR
MYSPANPGANGSQHYNAREMHVNNNSGSGVQNNYSGSGTQHNYNGLGQNINHGSGDQNINSGSGQFHVNNQGRCDSLKPAKRHAPALLKHTSALDKLGAVDCPTDSDAAQEDLKEVEQRLEANDFLDWKDDKAQKLLDQFHRVSEVVTGSKRGKILDRMNVLSKKSNLLPNCLWIQHGVRKLDQQAVDETGGYASVWRGMIGENSEIVALKIIKRNVEGEVEKLLGELIRETLVWRQLEHKNIVPFKGAYLFNEEPKEFCLVSPWMENGNLASFVKKSSPSITPELQYNLALNIATGLAYLHDRGITHGDIKGNNILIDSKNNARITDFGLSRIANATSTATTSTSRRNALGPAPELLLEETGPTPASDVYAYGCIYAKIEPFHGVADPKVSLLVCSQHKRPDRVEGAFSDMMWNLMSACWGEAPVERLVASKIVDRLEKGKGACIKIRKGSEV